MFQKKSRFYYFFIILFALAFLNSKLSLAQADSLLKKVSCDCDSAIHLTIFKESNYGYTQAPKGYGKTQEITAKSYSVKTAFEQEHHSAWYLLEFQKSGEFLFEIRPKSKYDDYDFLLFPYKDSLTCLSILQEKTKAIRGNLSRNDTNNSGITGLSKNVQNEFNGKGVGAQFSKSIDVKSGEKYLLVLDNVYEDGMGHKLFFSFIKDVNINGIVVSEEGKPLQAEVTLYDEKGSEIIKTSSDSKGEYKMAATIVENTDYSLTYTADNSFVATETINTKTLKNTNTFASIKTVLPKLKKGNKYKMGNLNFWGDSPKILPRSIPTLISLHHLMKKNKELKIQIEGHVNGGEQSKMNNSDHQLLSEQRADAVFDYLKDKGINESRMSKIGYADKFMIYPKPINFYEHEANRRVEIKVVSIKD